MYLNYAMEHFSELILTIKLTDETFVVEQILKCAYDLLYDFFNASYLFFYEFFNVFPDVNLSYCYIIAANKPKFGPYNRCNCYCLRFRIHMGLGNSIFCYKKFMKVLEEVDFFFK